MTDVENNPEVQEGKSGRGSLWQVVIWVVVILVLGVVGIQLVSTQKAPLRIGDQTPDFVLTTFDGQRIDSRDLRGKVIVLNIWASWCKPCELEAAELQEAWETYQPTGEVVFLGAAYTDTDKEAAAYMERFGITYPSGHDLRTFIYDNYNATGVPETFIIDRDGVLANKKIGPFQSLDEIFSVIEPLLN